MIRLSKMTDYGLVIMHCLAGRGAVLQSSTQIAEACELGLPTVSKLLKALVGAGFVHSVRGASGGYALSLPADQITLAAVITALEGAPSLTDCNNDNRSCEHTANCGLRDNWSIINQAIAQTLSKISMADMLSPLCQKSLSLKGIPIQVEAK